MTRVLPCLAGSILAAVLVPTAGAQPFPPNDRVDRFFAEWSRPDSPGCTLGVVRDGRFIYQRGYGMANLDYDIPNRPGLVYYMGSVSKQFAAAAIALLVLDGRISLDDDIRKYFPEMPSYGTPVTVRHMVYHTSGIRDIYGIMALAGKRMEDVITDSQAIALIARQKELNFKPGDQYLYSNSGYFLLGQLVKRVTGKSLREFADERIFRPLGMTQTHFHDDPGHIMKLRAMSYEPANARRNTMGTEEGSGGGYRISYLQNFDKIGAGGLYTTLDDLLKWDQNYYAPKVGGQAFLSLVRTRGVLNNGDTLTYAFGNNVSTYRGLRTDEHGGALMGYKAALLRFPDQRFTVMAQCNYGPIDPSRLANQVAEVYLGDLMKPPATAATAPARSRLPLNVAPVEQRLLGSYYGDEVDATYTVRAAGSRMVLARPLQVDTLMATADGGYQAADIVLRFQGPSGQPASSFTVQAGRVQNVRFVRRN
jgi:CubicO group peptidase (beta-lactamase class C family)